MKRLAVIALASLLGGCIPIVISKGYLGASRQNVPAEVPAFVETGRTTMADLVLAFGEPDVVAEDESWMTFASSYSEGGGGMVIVAAAGGTGGALGGTHEDILFRRLVVRLDAAGTVTSARVDGARCPHNEIIFGQSSSTSTSPSCLDVRSRDLVAADLVRRLESTGETGVVVFDGAEWVTTRQRGMLIVSDGAVTFMPFRGASTPAPGDVRLSFADLDGIKVQLPWFHGDAPGRYQAVLRRGDGGVATFILLDSSGLDDPKRTEEAARLIEKRLASSRQPTQAH